MERKNQLVSNNENRYEVCYENNDIASRNASEDVYCLNAENWPTLGYRGKRSISSKRK